MQPPDKDKTWVIEICPACTLKTNGLYQPYKGNSEDKLETRQYILYSLEQMGLSFTNDVKRSVLENPEGDALDSILAAYATYNALKKIEYLEYPLPERYMREVFIFEWTSLFPLQTHQIIEIIRTLEHRDVFHLRKFFGV